MDAGVVIELWMKGDPYLVTKARRHDVAINLRQLLRVIAQAGDEGRTDEGHGDAPKSFEARLGMKASQLPAVGVASHCDGHGRKARRAAL